MRLLVCLALVGAVCAQIPGEMQSLSVRVGLTSRSFSLYVPTNWTASAPIPLVLNWHGLTHSPDGQASISKANDYAELYGWAVAYPSGTLASHNGGACCPSASTLRINDVGFARALVADVSKRMPIRADAVFTMGFSNGAFMSERLACDAAELFAAVGSNAGRRAFAGDFKSCNPSRPIPVIAIQGTLDILVPYIGNPLIDFPSFAEDLSNMQTDMGCNANESPYVKNVTSTTTCELYSQCGRPEVFLEYCTVRGGDHSWFTAPDIDTSGYFFARFAEVVGIEPKPFLNLPKTMPELPETLVPLP